MKAIGIGEFTAHQTILYCKKHPQLGSFHSQEIAELAPENSNVTYSVIAEVGKLRFMEHRQVDEIARRLQFRHSVILSHSEIDLLIDKFIFYLAAIHQESTPLIRSQIQAQGGYILHLDATCEGDSPKLVSSVDSVSGLVLYSAKVHSENSAELTAFLQQIKDSFGLPHAVVSDMSKGIRAAVLAVFGAISHYICHFHFMQAIGKRLFEKEHIALRNKLSKGGISGKLKEMKKNMSKKFQQLSIDDCLTYLQIPESLGKTREATDMLVYLVILWILDHPSQGNGYGFPFDQRYLYFYERLHVARTLLDSVKDYYPAINDWDTSIWKLYHLIEKIVDDSKLKQIVSQYNEKLVVFSDLRKALGVAPKSGKQGFRQNSKMASSYQHESIKKAVERLMTSLEKRIKKAKNNDIKKSFIHVKERIQVDWQRLFADPIEVNVNGRKRTFYIHRTNNIMEQQFRSFAYSYRRIHGNGSIKRNLENIPEALPLVANLKNPDYVRLVFGNEENITKKFASIDISKIRAMVKKHDDKKKNKNSKKNKKLLRNANLYSLLDKAFAVVAK